MSRSSTPSVTGCGSGGSDRRRGPASPPHDLIAPPAGSPPSGRRGRGASGPGWRGRRAGRRRGEVDDLDLVERHLQEPPGQSPEGLGIARAREAPPPLGARGPAQPLAVEGLGATSRAISLRPSIRVTPGSARRSRRSIIGKWVQPRIAVLTPAAVSWAAHAATWATIPASIARPLWITGARPGQATAVRTTPASCEATVRAYDPERTVACVARSPTRRLRWRGRPRAPPAGSRRSPACRAPRWRAGSATAVAVLQATTPASRPARRASRRWRATARGPRLGARSP